MIKITMADGGKALIALGHITAIVEMSKDYGENLLSICSSDGGPPIHVNMTLDDFDEQIKIYKHWQMKRIVQT